jgi:hypothetical protein
MLSCKSTQASCSPIYVEHVEVDAAELADERLPQSACHADVGLQDVQDRPRRVGVLETVDALLSLRHDFVPPLQEKAGGKVSTVPCTESCSVSAYA